jgi:hypothetical protein
MTPKNVRKRSKPLFGITFIVILIFIVFVPSPYSILTLLGFIFCILWQIAERLEDHYYLQRAMLSELKSLKNNSSQSIFHE